MKRKLYLECNAGISGDMTVAALIDLGADKEKLMKALDSIPVRGFDISFERVKKAGLDCQGFSVLLDKEYENHDHDMEYLHGHDHHHHDHDHHHDKYDHEHDHDDHHHDPDQHDDYHDHDHNGPHRTLSDIEGILLMCSLSPGALELARKIFMILAKAEAKAHGSSMEEVRFHEVGAMDSIVDIVSAAVCLDDLGIEDVVIPYLSEGEGTVRCAHGILPVPVPAVANIVSDNALILRKNGYKGEFVTPTGAAIAAAVKTESVLPGSYRIIKTGLGAGKRNYELASILRAMIIEEDERTESAGNYNTVVKLETDMDDCTGEALGFVLERLYEAGAREAHYSPVFMKKNRPGYTLTVICDEDKAAELENIIFLNTTSIGIRKCRMERSVLEREIIEKETKYGPLRYKKVVIGDTVRLYPEYEDIAKVCREKGISFQEVYADIL